MRVLLIKDVYKLGRAGDVKRVADGYGRNYLLPQGMAVLATPGALKQVEQIKKQAATQRAALNQELSGVAEQLSGLLLTFGVRAGETGKLYGSITAQDVAEAIKAKAGLEVKRQQVAMQPIRTLGEHAVEIRLTMDLVPEIKVIVHREGETVEAALAEMEELAAMEAEAEEVVEEEPADEAEA
ncbi:MAG: 50S ribosomal protein L9 [Chloroflexota bacterium]